MMTSRGEIYSNSLIDAGYTEKLASVNNSVETAKEFEAMLLSMIFEKFEESVSNSENVMPGGDTLRDLGAQQLASAVSNAGGIGIAKLIAPYLQKHEMSSPISLKR